MEKLNSNFSVRQICIFLALVTPAIKLLILPSSYFFETGKDSVVAIFIQGLFDLITLGAILYVIKNDGRSFFEILCSSFGVAIAKIVFAFYALFFILKAFLPILEQLLMSNTVLYESTPSFLFYLPLFFAFFYSSVVGFNCIFRTAELMLPFIAFSFFGLIFLSFNSIKVTEAFPLFEFGLTPIKNGLTFHIPWFGDYIFLLLTLNNIDLKKKDPIKIVAFFFVGVTITAALFFIVLGIFGCSAPRQIFMLTKISKYSIAFSNLGRIDFLFIIIIFFAMILNACVFTAAATKCLTTVIKVKPYVSSIIVNLILAISSFLLVKDSEDVIFVYKRFLTPFFAVMQYLIPTILPIISFFDRQKRSFA